jgi:trehalose 6-phosphate synthase
MKQMNGSARAGRILLAANRGPVSFTQEPDGALSARRGGGGLVSALSSAAEAGQAGDLLWVCAALSDADRSAARKAPDGRLDLGGYTTPAAVQMLDIPPRVFDLAYNGVANSHLWFVSHLLYDTPNQPQFGAEFAAAWAAYRDYNSAFATALAENLAGDAATGARVMVQDYHLALVPAMLARLRPGVPTAHFSHTPWAPPDYFRILPGPVGREVLEGMLGADHAGFLCQRWADAFLDCCEAILGADVDRGRQQVGYRGHVCRVGVHPLGVDAAEMRQRAHQADVEAQVAALAGAASGRQVIVRVDRTELSKNIVRGLAAYRELLTSHPELHGRVTHLAFAYPSRSALAEYRVYTDSVLRAAAAINAEFGTPDWEPLILEVKDDYARSLAAYRLADVLVVNPIRDGMNLVAKEGPIVSDRGCALVLSEEAGARAELGEHALLINPYDLTGTAQAMYQALTMPQAERDARCAALARAGAALPPAQWLASQVAALG